MATLKRADLRDAVHHEIGLPRNEAAALVDTVIEAVAERLSAGKPVKISGFGSFAVRAKKARMGRNPKTGEPAAISPRRVVVFRASQKLRKSIGNGPAGLMPGPSLR